MPNLYSSPTYAAYTREMEERQRQEMERLYRDAMNTRTPQFIALDAALQPPQYVMPAWMPAFMEEKTPKSIAEKYAKRRAFNLPSRYAKFVKRMEEINAATQAGS